MDYEHNLLFGVLALQADLIDPARFAEACSVWSVNKNPPLPDLLVQRGWLSPKDRTDVERLLAVKLLECGGSARAGLDEVTQKKLSRTSAEGTDLVWQRDSDVTTAQPPVGKTPAKVLPEPNERYRLCQLHATGGIGRVWLARDESLGRDVALKEIRPERVDNPAVGARFLQEARITGQLEHPGIVPIYELVRQSFDRSPFYTMRFVRGHTLEQSIAQYHRNRGASPTDNADLRRLLTAFVGVCNAVAYAHSRGVLHRDLKPQNVVLGDFGEVIVLDWGLARFIGQADSTDAAPVPAPAEVDLGDTVQGQVLGTPAYMAPEQAEGHLDRLGPGTDVYGLGAILYEILTGLAPFTGSHAQPILEQVIHNPPQSPRSLIPKSPAALEAICLKALAKKPEQRYITVTELSRDVERWLADDPVSVYREPWLVRAGRWARLHRVLVTATAAAVMVALAGLATVLAVEARSNRQLREANERERARFGLAMEAIRTFHTGVSEDVLLRQQELKSLRNKLLSGAADFYRKLEGSLAAQADPESRSSLGKAYFELGLLTGSIGSTEDALAIQRRGLAEREKLAAGASARDDAHIDVGNSLLAIGNLLSETGQPAEALAAYDRAQQVLEQSAAARGDAVSRRSLAHCHTAIAVLKGRTGKPAEALPEYQAAEAIYQQLVDAAPDAAADQALLARSFMNIGSNHFRQGDMAGALASAEKARPIFQRLIDAYPGNDDYREGLAKAEEFFASVYVYTKSSEQALTAFEKARALYQQVANANPAVADYQDKLARCCLNLSLVQSRSGNQADALTSCQTALAIYRKLVEAHPAVTDYQFYLADCQCDVGDQLAKTNQWDAATAAYQTALKITETIANANPDVTEYRYRFARAVKRLGVVEQHAGRPAEAIAAFRRGISILESVQGHGATDTELVYNLACYRALLSGAARLPGSGMTNAAAQAEADKAMKDVQRAIDSGLRDPDIFRGDTDLDPLRDREDFKAMLRKLEAGASSGGK